MLLRSASTPTFNSWLLHAKGSSFSADSELVNPVTRKLSFTALASSSFSSSFPTGDDSSVKKVSRTRSENDLQSLYTKKKKPFSNIFGGSALDEDVEEKVEETREVNRDVEFGIGNGMYGFERPLTLDLGVGGGGSDDGDDGNTWFVYSNHGNGSMDVNYQKMIEANPGNPLILSNYAKYLKEVRGDFVKAEEYLGRAILANPTDGNSLSMYADLIWKSHADADRAETYHSQAVKAAPDDCHVLASYASFLWDAEEGEEEEAHTNTNALPTFFHGVPLIARCLAAAT